MIKAFGVDPDTSRTAAKAVLTRYDETGEPPLPSKRKSNQKKNQKPKTNENNTPIVVSPGKRMSFVHDSINLHEMCTPSSPGLFVVYFIK